MRALAVTLVVLYHLWPSGLTGGYVGVDVFFVISGYLITSHLVRGMRSPNPFKLGRFYARRIRRLLPASLLVLVIVGAVTLLAVPSFLWLETGRQLTASAFYIENWALAFNATDYSAPEGAVSPVQHFWSLSVEEQFYLVWPLILLGMIWVEKRIRNRDKRSFSVVIVGLATVALVSLIYSILTTNNDASFSYFVTPARAWEFALGGLISVIPLAKRFGPTIRAICSWVGLAMIAYSAIRFDASTPFPGSAALVPVVGTILVILAGHEIGSWSPAWIYRLRPVQWVGDQSYSIYLWHWPLIVLIPLTLGIPLSNLIKIAVILTSLLLAFLSKRFVEDRFRASKTRDSDRRVFLLAMAGMIVVALIGATMFAGATAQSNQARSALQQSVVNGGKCFGALALDTAASCPGVFDSPAKSVQPALVIATDDQPPRECQSDTSTVINCQFGSTEPNSTKVALVGDSHATQWLPSLDAAAKKFNWSMTTYLKSGCTFSSATKVGSPVSTDSCDAWNSKVQAQLSGGAYKLIFTSGVTGNSYKTVDGESSEQAAVAGLEQSWSAVIKSGAILVSMRDTPRPDKAGISDPLECLSRATMTSECELQRTRALIQDYQVPATQAVPGSVLVDMTESFCNSAVCPTVVGGVLVYRDRNHVSSTYMGTVASDLELKLKQALPLFATQSN